MEWGAVSTKLGVLHILIFRDSQFASLPHLCNRVTSLFRDAYDLFDIAKDVGALELLIVKRLQNQIIDNDIMEMRNDYFEKYVSSMKINATEKYVALIKRVAGEEPKREC